MGELGEIGNDSYIKISKKFLFKKSPSMNYVYEATEVSFCW